MSDQAGSGKTFGLKPKVKEIKGHKYFGPVVFKVESSDELGRPSKVTIGYDDTTFNIENGTQFFTGYISATAVDGARNPRAKA